jgi:hypothetical protein
LQLFCSFISDPKNNKDNKEKKETKESKEKIEKKKEEINKPELKNEINNNKYVSAFLFSTFKLIEKVRNIFLFEYIFIIVK